MSDTPHTEEGFPAQELDDDAMSFYGGGRFFLAESMGKGMAQWIADQLCEELIIRKEGVPIIRGVDGT